MRLSRTATYEFQPCGMDLFDPKPFHPKAGDLVRITQPHGCPKNGTMGFTYVEDAATGEFRGLVRISSLEKIA
jgi:hypothetical protein